MKQTITIDGEPYRVDVTVAGAIDELQDEIESLRSVLVRLASFVGGDPCWCQCYGFEHSQACKDARNLRLWKSPSGISLPWKDPEVAKDVAIAVSHIRQNNSKPQRKSKKQSIEDTYRESDLTAQLIGGRPEIDYGPHDSLPRGEHVARLGFKVRQRK